MPRILEPTKRRAGNAGRQVSRMAPTPYWKPMDEYEGDEDYVDDEKETTTTTIPSRSHTHNHDKRTNKSNHHNHNNLHSRTIRSTSHSPPPASSSSSSSLLLLLDHPSKIATTTTTTRTGVSHRRRLRRSSKLAQRSSLLLLDDDNDDDILNFNHKNNKKNDNNNNNNDRKPSTGQSKPQLPAPLQQQQQQRRTGVRVIMDDEEVEEEYDEDEKVSNADQEEEYEHIDDDDDLQKKKKQEGPKTPTPATDARKSKKNQIVAAQEQEPLPTIKAKKTTKTTTTPIISETNSPTLPTPNNDMASYTNQSPIQEQPRATNPPHMKLPLQTPPRRQGTPTPTRPSPRMTQVVVVAAAHGHSSPPHATNAAAAGRHAHPSSPHQPQFPSLLDDSFERRAIRHHMKEQPPQQQQLQQQVQPPPKIQQQQQQPKIQRPLQGLSSPFLSNKNEHKDAPKPPETQTHISPSVAMMLSGGKAQGQKELQQEEVTPRQNETLESTVVTKNFEQRPAASLRIENTLPPPLVPTRTVVPEAVVQVEVAKSRDEDFMPRALPHPVYAAAAHANNNNTPSRTLEAPNCHQVPATNNNDDCCMCCKCVRRRRTHHHHQHQPCQQCGLVRSVEDHNDDHDDDDDNTNVIKCPCQHQNYEEMMDIWRNCEARLAVLTRHVDRVTRAIFPPLATMSDITPSGPFFYHEQQPPPQRPSSHRRQRRKRVMIDDDHEAEDEDDYVYWEDYGAGYGRQERSRSWSGHDERHFSPRDIVGASFPSGGSHVEGNVARWRYDATQEQNRSSSELPVPTRDAHRVRRSSSSSSRRSESGRDHTVSRNHDSVNDEQRVFDTQPYQQLPRNAFAQREESPRNEKISREPFRRQDRGESLHAKDVVAAERQEGHELASPRSTEDTHHDRKKRRLERESPPQPPPPQPKEVIDMCDSNDDEVSSQDDSVLQGQGTTLTRQDIFSSHPNETEESGLGSIDALKSFSFGDDPNLLEDGTVQDHQEVQTDGTNRREIISLGDNDEESSDGDELIPFAQPLMRANILATLKSPISPGNASLLAAESMLFHPSRLPHLQHQLGKTPVSPTVQLKKFEDAEEETIHLLDDFLSSRGKDQDDAHEAKQHMHVDEKEFDSDAKSTGGRAKSAQQGNPNGTAKSAQRDEHIRTKVGQSSSVHDIEAGPGQRAAEAQVGKEVAEERSLLKDHQTKKRLSVERRTQRDSNPSSRAKQIQNKHIHSPQVVAGKDSRSKELEVDQTPNLHDAVPPRAPKRTTSRNLRDVVPKFDSLATFGRPQVQPSSSSRKRGRIEISMP